MQYKNVGTTAAVVDANPPGRILGIQTLSASSAAYSIYDNATTNSGNILFTSLATTVVGAFVPIGPTGVGIPYSNGLYANTSGTSGTFVVVYSNNCPNDGRLAT